ncbi:YjeF family protein [Pseudooceanicola batsensis HTCC2597]|uniref:Bifunctional NAD(P)H-hydrate repair enzyme n=1 Tax=Pseudooceanicola batsensis (strain ATCC BAA-863 / DSM 15984 / KCTC 12145 / HTCC2597) TaxID=252305 RepID=A3U3U9_PSEBH|nr:bifunctional ADP-dependent NAD(P)H-hydrate dehydratase/NAD(P)H-hydrate epimerase [Pseudooceanicola batsensis]EAQ01188.1 YjeF family protein [Pseudooceanicola batsensis HTCC2597]
MTELLTSAQMRDIEGRAIDSGAVTGLELMERAGRGVVDAVLSHWPQLLQQRGPGAAGSSHAKDAGFFAGRRAVVLCGPGNNGGDGYVVARLLHEMGWQVTVLGLGDPERLPPDARENCERWRRSGQVAALTLDALRAATGGPRQADLLIDALFGTGATRPVTGAARAVLDHLGDAGAPSAPVVCIDAPSGMCLDSGRILGAPGGYGAGRGFAALTVTFDSPKIGHMIGDGPRLCGALQVIDIGLEPWRTTGAPQSGEARPIRCKLVGPRLVADRRDTWQPARVLGKRDHAAHKFDHGHCVVLSGGAARTGAARLAARAALRAGAGLVTLATPPDAVAEVAAQSTAVMVREVPDAEALRRMLEDDRIVSVCLGPGLGVGAATRDLVAAALETDKRVVLDADALTAFAEAPAALYDLVREDRVVLTPHGGEFKRLFPDVAERWTASEATSGPAFSKVDAAREAAALSRAVVLLKGADTVIAAAGGEAAVHAAVRDRSAPWLATAGAGDVLSGIIAGLMARGIGAMQAAECGAWLHVEAALDFGPGMIAEDLPECLPAVFRRLDDGDR